MATKIEAAQMAAQSGTQTIIASSSRPNILIDLAEGKRIGTLFLDEMTFSARTQTLPITQIHCATEGAPITRAS